MNFEALPRDFYQGSAAQVAPELLGHFLLHRVDEEWVGGEIVETEAYLSDDPACHAYVRETPRNRVMWGEHGYAYVFRIYGAYYCVNAVCQPKGVAEAVLIRAVEPRFGLPTMETLRPVAKLRDLTNGPSKLCISMGIGAADNGLDLTDAHSPLIIARNPARDAFLEKQGSVVQTTRIGLTRAADWPLRWILAGSTAISRRGLPAIWPEGITTSANKSHN
jgi:DNA-3-methyladenine glycosylase